MIRENITKFGKTSSPPPLKFVLTGTPMPLPAVVGGASGSQKIAEMWKNHFSNLLKSVANEYKEFFYNNITYKNSNTNLSQYICDYYLLFYLYIYFPNWQERKGGINI